MNGILDYLAKESEANELKFYSPAATIAFREITSFYHDADAFMTTKRFDRFASLIEDKIDKFIIDLNIMSVSSSNFGKEVSRPSFYKCLKAGVVEHSVRKLMEKKSDELDETVSIDHKDMRLSISFYNLINAIPEKVCSPLYDLSDIIGETVNYDELYKEGTVTWQDKEFQSPILTPVLNIVNDDDMFSILCRSCLERACYDFVHLQALEQKLVSESWFSTVKNITTEQVLWLMSVTFEHLMYEIETRAGCLCLYSMPKDSPAVFHELRDAKDTIENLTEQLALKCEQALEVVGKRDREISDLKGECKQLRDKLQLRSDNADELLRLKRQFKAMEQENQQLKDKLASAEQYADELQKALNEPDAEPDTDTTIDLSEYSGKRIVFVRDKENENYVFLKRLAETFPNARFTNCIASEINARTTDLIVVFTSYVCHGTFWNAMSIAKRKNIPVLITYKANYDMIVADIVSELQLASQMLQDSRE